MGLSLICMDQCYTCLGTHLCPKACMVDGICEQKVHLMRSARTYAGARGSFEYIFQEMNGCKKQCARVLASGMTNHEGSQHSCLAQACSDPNQDVGSGKNDASVNDSCSGQSTGMEGRSQVAIHYCDVRCPSCNYYCNKPFGHMGIHSTSHGNMQQTYFLAKGNDIDVAERKYRVGERGIAEMCNLFCTKMGRGHIHYLPCEGNGRVNCVYASKDHRRHCVDKLYPSPKKEMDELLHSQFWSTIGWDDPCTEEERGVFAKCPFVCSAPEHDEANEQYSYCVLDAWHLPALQPDVEAGFAYIDGHKFVVRTHGGFREFTINRSKDGGEDDVVSFVTFDNKSRIHCEARPLKESLHMILPYSGGGTSFEEGLRVANEVLSRNDYETYKVVLIFFSDGHPWDIKLGITLVQHIRSVYAKYDLKTFVGFGHVNLPVLERMAVEMGGEYRHVLGGNELQSEFQRIAAVLNNSEASLALLES
ncbi:unnamed protein product [Phytophthora fragariaefolia]|uniref:Unnamed protein product n=1 Tax=Phytophthora fragariaefolia TaxID=1490495 RepID=A0A9W6Y0X6_9STRA|nr:unnamed protein product [Phytophthora fragariaefolia]